MKRLKRAEVLQAMRAAGTQGDKTTFYRLFVEYRVSYDAAHEAYREGQHFKRFIEQRDAQKAQEGDSAA